MDWLTDWLSPSFPPLYSLSATFFESLLWATFFAKVPQRMCHLVEDAHMWVTGCRTCRRPVCSVRSRSTRGIRWAGISVRLEAYIKTHPCPGPHPVPHWPSIREASEACPQSGEAGRAAMKVVQDQASGSRLHKTGDLSLTSWNINELLWLVTHPLKLFTWLDERHSKPFCPCRHSFYRSPQGWKAGSH